MRPPRTQPTLDSLPVDRYVPPEEFDELGAIARSMGFRKVASGTLVRSSYHARDMAEDELVGEPTRQATALREHESRGTHDRGAAR